MLDKQLQTVSQKTIQNWLQKRYSHTFRPSNINDLRLSGRALTRMKNKTPSYPPVRGRLVTFSACVLPQGRSLYLASPLQGDKRGSYSFQRANRQFINKWNPRQKIRPQIRDSRSFCNALTVRALQKSKKKDGLFSPEIARKPPEKHWYCEVKAWILRGNNLVIAG